MSFQVRGRFASTPFAMIVLAVAGTAAAQLPPFPPRPVRPLPPVIIGAPTYLPATTMVVPGMCANYDATVASSGVISPNGTRHPGACGWIDADFLFEGLPFAQYWQSVMAGTLAPPYTLTFSSEPTGECATITKFTLHLSARVQPSTLGWTPNRPSTSACATQWSQHNPASSINPSALQSTVGTFLANYAGELDRVLEAGTPLRQCSNGKGPFGVKEVERLVMQAVGQGLTNVVNRAQAQWRATQSQLAGPTSGNACTLRCNICDSAGWAGTIVMNETVTSVNNYVHHETDTFYVGGVAQTIGNRALVSTDWSAVGGGSQTGSSWTVNAFQPGTCSPPGNGVCLEVLPQPLNSPTTLKFDNVNMASFSVPGGLMLSQGQSAPVPGAATETNFPPFTTPVGATAASGATTVSTTYCYTPMTPSAGTETCTQQWSWNLDKR